MMVSRWITLLLPWLASLVLFSHTHTHTHTHTLTRSLHPTPQGDGLSILDVVRHGVKTIMQLLEPGDRLAVVKYSSTAAIVHRLTFMNDAGKALSQSKLDELKPSGTTNLYVSVHT